MKHLTDFDTYTAYTSFQNSEDYESPNVSYISSRDSVEYDKFLTFKLKSLSGAIEINKVGTASNLTSNIEYSLDRGLTWENYTFNGSQGLHIVLEKNYDKHGCDNIKFKGINTKFSHSSNTYYNFAMSGDFNARGDVTSLINGAGGDCALPNFAFVGLFCGCTSLLTPPKLPSTTLSKRCYDNLFRWCSSIKIAPELPATNLAADAYWCMFSNSKSLTGAPYIASPANPAATPTRLYQRMFEGCSNLTYIKAMFTSWPVASNGNSVTAQWVASVKSTGTFVANANASFLSNPPRGAAGIPNNWTIQTAAT